MAVYGLVSYPQNIIGTSIRKEEDFKAVKGMPGMYYKVYRPNIAIGKCHSK
jgi:hypothetical protein